MPIVASDYQAPAWCPGGHLQTVIPARLTPKPEVRYRREIVRTFDDDIVAWDWVDPPAPSAETPILVHFHGLEGASDSHYALALMKTCLERGWRGVVAHFRTCGGLMNLKPRAYYSGDSGDCRASVRSSMHLSSTVSGACWGITKFWLLVNEAPSVTGTSRNVRTR